MTDRVAVVTGASSGIGEAIAEEYARRGVRVALLARRVDRLEALAERLGGPARALAVPADVCSDASLEAATAAVLAHFGRIDVVIANAGIPMNGALESLTVSDYQRQLDVNTFGVLRTVYATLPAIKAARGAYGLVGSLSGYISVPGTTAYSMSKFAVRALAEGLRAELGHVGVSVTHLAPGFVESEIRTVDNRGALHADAADPAPKWIVMPRHKAAREMVSAVERRKRERVITGHAKVILGLANAFPTLLHAVMKRVPLSMVVR